MKRYFLSFVPMILLIIAVQTDAQNQSQFTGKEVDYPEVPRVSAYEAYVKYKAGKALIFYGGGELYSRRHIVGSINLDVKDNEKDKILPKFPKSGIEIFTYCY